MITQARLKELLHYDPDTGVFIWVAPVSRRIRVGGVAGSVKAVKSGKKYNKIQIDGKLLMAHRLAWIYVYGKIDDSQIDHIDGNGLNNLRLVDSAENNKNIRLSNRSRSGVPGVYLLPSGRWRACIGINRVKEHLGSFPTREEAISCRKKAERRYGFHENHGQIRPL
jgi:hypothetical protein